MRKTVNYTNRRTRKVFRVNSQLFVGSETIVHQIYRLQKNSLSNYELLLNNIMTWLRRCSILRVTRRGHTVGCWRCLKHRKIQRQGVLIGKEPRWNIYTSMRYRQIFHGQKWDRDPCLTLSASLDRLPRFDLSWKRGRHMVGIRGRVFGELECSSA